MWLLGFWVMVVSEGAQDEIQEYGISLLEILIVLIIFPILFPITLITLYLERNRQ